MEFPSWQHWFARARTLRPQQRPHRRPSFRHGIEPLEDRLVPITTTWTGGALDGLWDTAGNWNNGVPNAAADIAIFSGVTGGTVQINGNFTVGTLSFTNTAGSFVLQAQASGDSLTIANNGTL